MKKNEKLNKKLIRICYFLIIVIIGIIFVGIKFDANDEKQTSDDKTQNSVVIDEESTIAQIADLDAKKKDGFEISTPYGNLYYPKKLKDSVTIIHNEENAYKVEFYANFEEKDELHLFDVCFNSDDGDLLGYIDNADEVVNISIDIHDFNKGVQLTQEEIDTCYLMQEEMNYVIEMLNTIEGYVAP